MRTLYTAVEMNVIIATTYQHMVITGKKDGVDDKLYYTDIFTMHQIL